MQKTPDTISKTVMDEETGTYVPNPDRIEYAYENALPDGFQRIYGKLADDNYLLERRVGLLEEENKHLISEIVSQGRMKKEVTFLTKENDELKKQSYEFKKIMDELRNRNMLVYQNLDSLDALMKQTYNELPTEIIVLNKK